MAALTFHCDVNSRRLIVCAACVPLLLLLSALWSKSRADISPLSKVVLSLKLDASDDLVSQPERYPDRPRTGAKNPAVTPQRVSPTKAISLPANKPVTHVINGDIPAWVPTIPWRWTTIPGTNFADYIKDNGSGIAPPHGAPIDRGDHALYQRIYSDGGPAYSAKRHEMYLIGGGHAASSSNILVRWNLGNDQPDMDVAEMPTPREVRKAEVNTPKYLDKSNGYYSDGRPIAFHAYHNVHYLDAIDELVVIMLYAANTSTVGGSINYRVGAGWHRKVGWRPKKYWPDPPPELQNYVGVALAFPSPKGDAIYMTRGGGPLRRLDAYTRQWSVDGTARHVRTYANKGAINPHSGKALVLEWSADDYFARYFDIDSGEATRLTVRGDLHPPGLRVMDIAWVDPLSGWVAVFGKMSPARPDPWRLFLLQPLDSESIIAREIPTSAGPVPTDTQVRRVMHYDPAYQVLLFATYNGPLKALRVGPLP